MKKRRCQTGFTLIEMLVAISIIAIMISLIVPATNSMLRSHRKASAKNLIRTALAQAQAYAVKERKYAGLRFQPDGDGRQYLVLVEAKRVVITDGESAIPGAWDYYDLMDLYVPVDNVLPVALPVGIVVLNASYIYIDLEDPYIELTQDEIIVDFELDSAATFCILYSPSGQLVKKQAQCGPRTDSTSFQLEYGQYANLNDTIFVGHGIAPPSEGLPLPGDLICLNNLPRPVKDSQTGLLLYERTILGELNPEDRFYYIFNVDELEGNTGEDDDENGKVDDYFNQVQPAKINVYTGKLIEEE